LILFGVTELAFQVVNFIFLKRRQMDEIIKAIKNVYKETILTREVLFGLEKTQIKSSTISKVAKE
jgi:hypothetical protein